jgi:hypothetical protein
MVLAQTGITPHRDRSVKPHCFGLGQNTEEPGDTQPESRRHLTPQPLIDRN